MDPEPEAEMRTRPILLPLALVVGIVLSACGASDGDDSAGYDTGAVGEADMEAPRDAAVEDGATDAGASSGGVIGAGQSAALIDRQIIQTADVTVRADDPEAFVEALTRRVEAAGGFVAAADLFRYDDEDDTALRGSLTLRVPADRLSDTLAEVESLATEVVRTSLSTQDVTGEVIDVEARLSNLRTLESELVGFLQEARDRPSATPEEILRIFQQVSDVRGEIEGLEQRRDNLRELVSLATLVVSVEPTSAAAPVVPEGWSPGTVLRDAARATVGALQWLVELVIWLVVTALPVGLVFGAPFAIGWWGVRRWRASRRRRLPAPPTPPAAPAEPSEERPTSPVSGA